MILCLQNYYKWSSVVLRTWLFPTSECDDEHKINLFFISWKKYIFDKNFFDNLDDKRNKQTRHY